MKQRYVKPHQNIIVSDGDHITEVASNLFDQATPSAILSYGYSAEELISIFQSVDCIFTDADGTVVEEGLTTFPATYSEYVQQLADLGITTTMVTGKPYAEISKLVESLPAGSPLRIIYEKGAYYLEPDKDGVMHKRYLLSSPELEASVLDLRRLFLENKKAIEDKYQDVDGAPLITLGWSGSGQHQSVLGIDIFAGVPPADYLQIVGPAREDLKVKDLDVLANVEVDLQKFVDTFRPGWRLVHLGNGNSEIAPDLIEKDIAIMQMDEFKNANSVLVWGDSGNDKKMFELNRLPKVHSGLVLHRKNSISLVNSVDFVSFGMANAKPFFDLLLRSHVDGR